MNKLKSKIFKLIEANSVDIEESSKNGIIAHYVDVDELVDDLFSLYNVVKQSEQLNSFDEWFNKEWYPEEYSHLAIKEYLKTI
tara:strand:+ start:25 stop:273 length:249 start_codon:yes stop_codon:yes gene_type:complete